MVINVSIFGNHLKTDKGSLKLVNCKTQTVFTITVIAVNIVDENSTLETSGGLDAGVFCTL